MPINKAKIFSPYPNPFPSAHTSKKDTSHSFMFRAKSSPFCTRPVCYTLCFAAVFNFSLLPAASRHGWPMWSHTRPCDTALQRRLKFNPSFPFVIFFYRVLFVILLLGIQGSSCTAGISPRLLLRLPIYTRLT